MNVNFGGQEPVWGGGGLAESRSQGKQAGKEMSAIDPGDAITTAKPKIV